MSSEVHNDELIVKYLLDELPQPERELVEARYFADPDFLEQVNAVEGELLERYARDELTAEQAGKVKQRLLTSPHQQEKLIFTSTLIHSLNHETEPVPRTARMAKPEKARWYSRPALVPFLATAGVVVAAVALVVCGWMISEFYRLRRQLEGIQQEQVSLRQAEQKVLESLNQQREQITQSLGGPETANRNDNGTETQNQNEAVKRPPQTPAVSLATFVLSPPAEREGAEPKVLVVKPNVRRVLLRLIYEGESYPTYRAVLENTDGDELWSRDEVKATESGSRKVLSLVVPAAVLENRTYILTLRDPARTKTLQRYTFTISRRRP